MWTWATVVVAAHPVRRRIKCRTAVRSLVPSRGAVHPIHRSSGPILPGLQRADMRKTCRQYHGAIDGEVYFDKAVWYKLNKITRPPRVRSAAPRLYLLGFPPAAATFSRRFCSPPAGVIGSFH